MKKYYIVNVVCVVLVFAAVICLMSFFPRSYDYIDEEKRLPTKFPRFGAEAYFKGDYTAQISEWYTDSVPYRKGFREMTARLKSLYGVSTKVSGHDLRPGAHDSRPDSDVPYSFDELPRSAEEYEPPASVDEDIFGD